MNTFEIERSIRLPVDSEFYTRKRKFPFFEDPDGCAASARVGDKDVTLSIHPDLRERVNQFAGGPFEASFEEITEASMQFFQGEGSIAWPAERYRDKLHFLRYEVGLAFQDGQDDSASLKRDDVLHGEARKPLIELIAYGLAVLAAAKMFDVTTDRFTFVLGAASRPDFSSSITAQELLSDNAHTKLLTRDNLRLGIESKGRNQHGGLLVTSGKNEGQPNDLLASIIKKYASLPTDEAMLAFVVSSQKSAPGKGVTKVTLADPGVPTALGEDEQVIFLLESLIPKLRRIGIWGSLHAASQWLSELGRPLSTGELEFLRRTPSSDAFLLKEAYHNSLYRGRYFGDVLYRLGNNSRRPKISRSEIEARLASNDAGLHWYHGIRQDILDALHAHDTTVIRGIGIGFDSAPATARWRVEQDSLDVYTLGLLQQALPYAR